jgi:ATP-dependent DNA ligase
MRSAFEFCLPTAAKAVPAGPDWIHEVKYDGYRLRVERSGKSVRLWTRNGHDWTDRFPWIVQAALKNREQHFVIDGEAVVLGVDGVSDFNALHSRRHDEEVQLYAFDILMLGSDDLRPLPLSLRKTNLARLLRGRPDGMFVAPFEAGEIGSDLYRRCPHGSGGSRLETARSSLQRWPLQGLDQGQEPDASGRVSGDGRPR